MRLGLRLPAGGEPEAARLAEDAGLFGVLVDAAEPGEEVVVAAWVAAVTEQVRVVVRVALGCEHPVTLAEDLAVLDNIAAGRLVVVADTAALDAEAALEDLELLRRCWSARPVRHTGRRWRVPAGIEGHEAPDAVAVTPEPAQVDVPVWLTGAAAPALSAATGLPRLAVAPSESSPDPLVSPALGALAGEVEADRATVRAYAAAGATHLLVSVPAGDVSGHVTAIARHLAGEAAMPDFPRVVTETVPPPWPPAQGSSPAEELPR